MNETLKAIDDIIKVKDVSEIILYYEKQMRYGSFIETHNDDWNIISKQPGLSEDFIIEFHDKVHWSRISMYQTLSESFMSHFEAKLDWIMVSRYQEFYIDFVEKYKHKLCWGVLSFHQPLSDLFLELFSEQVDWLIILNEERISDVCIEKYSNVILSQYNTPIENVNDWLSYHYRKKHMEQIEQKIFSLLK